MVEPQRPESPVTVAVQNRSSVAVDEDELARLAASALAAESVVGPAHLDLAFVEPDEIAALNGAHMGKSGPTDVLSFPVDVEASSPGGPPRLLGDLIVCPAVAAQSPAVVDGTRDWSRDHELALLVVHGVLHLIGYDHADEAERLVMQGREIQLLADLCAITYVPGPETS